MSSLLQLSVKSLHHSQSSPTLEKWRRPKCLPICLEFIRVLNVYRLVYVSLIFMKASGWFLWEPPLSRPTKPPKKQLIWRWHDLLFTWTPSSDYSSDPPNLLCCRWLPIISNWTSLSIPQRRLDGWNPSKSRLHHVASKKLTESSETKVLAAGNPFPSKKEPCSIPRQDKASIGKNSHRWCACQHPLSWIPFVTAGRATSPKVSSLRASEPSASCE